MSTVPTPPSEAGLVAPPDRPAAWPSVIGIVAIVFGALGSIGACFGGTMMLFVDKFAELMPPGQAATFESLGSFKPMLIAAQLAGLVVALLLLFGGIQLVRRRPSAARLCVGWAVAKIAFVVVNSVLGWQVNQAQFAAMQEQMQNDPNMPALPGGLMATMGVVGVVFGILWGWALPVFMLIWFARRSVKEEIRSWERGPGLQ